MTEVWEDPRVAEGIELQDAELAKLLAGGARRVGWKAGFGSPAAMESLGTSGPIVGYLIDSTRLQPDSEVSISGWKDPRFEPELALRLGEDLQITGYAAAIELVDMDVPTSELARVLGSNVFHRHMIIGEFSDSAVPSNLVVTRDGETIVETDDPTGGPGEPDAVRRHIELWASACGESLHEGDLIMTGSIIPPVPAVPGEFRVALTGLDPVAVKLRN